MTEESRTKRLKNATHDAHERLDKRIMQLNPFADRGHYGRFLKMQYLFHRDLDALFFDGKLDALLPDLKGRRRLGLIERDMTDLGVGVPAAKADPRFVNGADVGLGEMLGWIYVIEGSNLGAAFLLKYAAKLGLDENFGARHLAGAPEGRGLHWRTFTAALDGVDLTQEDEQQAIAGAEAAFRRVYDLAEEAFVAL
ncbi:biliverdin-producing heme oxygenase [Rhizobium sp. 18055]|jgi:heme oxygenase|uniref:biliverdin-producing heme oxygenase n=1 Tax=Rhizobium sp. 18055 TaxID=2681403 RepID=UPI00135B1FE7|nr:biliverdin-producing heme oxygenase [Rhizobium sp. 18055]